ncbi:hypothetical protein M3Y96_00130800 [Aphelenchoides besseyi]|nr:hypothetical protein M3Y96_00130800 [Aphelenchoides besseyi]
MSSDSDSSVDETPTASNSRPLAPPRPLAPIVKKIPLSPEDEMPPPYSSHHAQSSNLLTERESSRTPNQRPIASIPKRTSRTPESGFRRHLTKRNLIVGGIGLTILLILLISFVVWLSSDGEPMEFSPGVGASSSSDRHVQPLDVKWKLLGAFREYECVHPKLPHRNYRCLFRQKMSFDEYDDAIILSKYFPEQHTLRSEKLIVSKHHDGFIYGDQNISAIYADCIRFTDDVTCCSTSVHSHSHRTDCYLNTDNQVIHSVASHYDFVHNWQSLGDESKLALVFNRNHYAILNLRSKRLHRIEENRLPPNYVSVGFFFPLDNADELDELVRAEDGVFRICEYKQKNNDENYALQSECRLTPFHVEYELPKVKFCSNPIYTSVVQYGHIGDESDLTFRVKVLFDRDTKVYGTRDSLSTPYEQLVVDCNDETIDIYVLGEAEVSQFSVQLPNLRSQEYIQTRL